jgi:hypothetical protein
MMVYLALSIMPGGTFCSGEVFGFDVPVPEVSSIARDALIDEVEDSCECSCTSTSCTPLDTFLKIVMSPKHARGVRSDFDYFARMVQNSIKILETVLDEGNLPKDVAMKVLRLYTFGVLECRHTCCIDWIRDYVYGRPRCAAIDPAEREEIHEEDSEKLEVLEQLLRELEAEYEKSGWGLLQFLQLHWLPLMRDLIEEEDARQLSQVEVSNITEIGVKLDLIPSQSEASAIQSVGKIEEHDSTHYVDLGQLQTDEERWRAVLMLVDNICE